MPRVTPLLLVLCAALAPACAVRAATEVETGVWRLVSSYLNKEAQIALGDLPTPADAAAQREHAFLRAVVLLDSQPLTESKLDQVEALLRGVMSGEDELAGAATYLLARSRQLFRQTADPVGAAELYRRLLKAPQSGLWADQARAKLALLELYVLPAPHPRARLAAVRTLLAEVEGQEARRDLHRLLARATLFYDLSPAAALADLEAAEAIGGLQGEPHADQLVQLAELNLEFGRPGEAARYHALLAELHPRDVRIWALQAKLAGTPAPARGNFGDVP